MEVNINDPILKLTDKQLMDYIKCPNLFYARYVSKIPIPEKDSLGSFVGEVINAYMFKLLEGKLPTIDKAKKIWDKICEDNPKTLNDRKTLEGWGMIKLFDKYCYKNRLVIADTDSPYEFDIGMTTVKGNLGTIRINDNSLELFVVECSQKQPEQQMLDMSLKYTLQLYVLNKLSSKYKINAVRILHLKSGREFFTYRNKNDYDRLERTIKNVSICIRNNLYYPREDYLCTQCRVKNYCRSI